MTRKRLDQIIDEVISETAKAHGLNCVPEAKGGELGDVMALVGRSVQKAKFDLVRGTGATVAIVSEGVVS